MGETRRRIKKQISGRTGFCPGIRGGYVEIDRIAAGYGTNRSGRGGAGHKGPRHAAHNSTALLNAEKPLWLYGLAKFPGSGGKIGTFLHDAGL
jgi:hypothetical protein